MENIVIKIWTESVLNESWVFDLKKLKIRNMIADIISLSNKWVWVVLVSSWAVWLWKTKLPIKPKWYSDMIYKQVCAWIWQVELMQNYSKAFDSTGISVFQLLCTHDDFHNKNREKSILSNLSLCLDNWIIPIINENDPLTKEELSLVWKESDNDNLALHVARLIKARMLMIITNENWVYDMEPSNPLAKRILVLNEISNSFFIWNEWKSKNWTWWMISKLKVAKIAQKAWIDVHILDWETSTVSDHYFWTQNWWTHIFAKN